jgi:hypothetical protein
LERVEYKQHTRRLIVSSALSPVFQLFQTRPRPAADTGLIAHDGGHSHIVCCQTAPESSIKKGPSPKFGGTMIWAIGVVGLLLVAGGAYREYFAENEDTEGEGSILTNGLFIAGVVLLVCAGLYGMYRMLS